MNRYILFLLLFCFAGCAKQGQEAPYSLIINDPEKIASFWGNKVGGSATWVLKENELTNVDDAIRSYIQYQLTVEKDEYNKKAYLFIQKNLPAYSREYCGVMENGNKYILCSMNNLIKNKDDEDFTVIKDGWSSVVRFKYDIKNRKILTLEWNGDA